MKRARGICELCADLLHSKYKAKMWAQGILIPKPMHSRQIIIAEIGGYQWYANDMEMDGRRKARIVLPEHFFQKPLQAGSLEIIYPVSSFAIFFAAPNP